MRVRLRVECIYNGPLGGLYCAPAPRADKRNATNRQELPTLMTGRGILRAATLTDVGQFDQTAERGVGRHQLVEGSGSRQTPVIQQEDAIALANGAEPVSN